ncbi:aspartyl/asparaginyl beta-hydroxylase domain-containing protein [Photobacterium kasasachensis]|uniref:aspartyl/asparaginyl beta-hydroxylase domain-containing protein n=1 Tax=Photobacterium kasasachensis TaxID=2910240 RepID=UPI003D0F3235
MLDIGFHRLPLDFPVSPTLLASIEALSDGEWLAHVNRACYDGAWEVFPLRGLSKYQDQSPILQAFALEESESEADFENYASLQGCQELTAFLSQLSCPILSVRLMRLSPGATIAPHRDHGLCFSKGQARLHLCLQTDPDVEFIVEGESAHMSEGELWYLNADREHAVYHRGSKDRIHVVIDCIANDWLRNMLGLPEHRELADYSVPERQAWLTKLAEQIVSCPYEERYGLRQPVRELATSLANLSALDLHPDIFLDTDFTMTPYGKAVSMTTAAQCAEEVLRTAVFVRGIHQAISERLHPEQPVSVLYAGTGPFATLLLPLMGMFSAEQLQVTMLDIHAESLEKLQSLVESFGLGDHVAEYICADATRWQSEEPFDFIVSETMKAALASEPQVSIFANLVSLLKPLGALIPQQVELTFNALDTQGARNPLGVKTQLDREIALSLSEGNKHALDACVVLPANCVFQGVEIRTEIQVYGQHRLIEPDSSLTISRTIPLLFKEDISFRSHDNNGEVILHLLYSIGAEPGYSASVVSSNMNKLSLKDELA